MLAVRTLALCAITLLAACGGAVRSVAARFLAPAPGQPPRSVSGVAPVTEIEVLIDVSALDKDAITLDLAPPVEARLAERQQRGPRGFTWYGRIPMHGIVILDVKDGAVTGIVETDNARYVLKLRDDGRYVLASEPRSPDAFKHPDSFKNVDVDPAKATRCRAVETRSTITLLIAYTEAAKRGALASGSDIELLIDHAVWLSNEASQPSRLTMTFELAHKYQTPEAERGDMDETLTLFRGTNDHRFDEVHRLRDAKRADICVIAIDGNGTFGGTTHVVSATAATAFAIVDYRFLNQDVLAHEIGHLMALHHTRDTNNDPCPEGRGYRHDNGTTDTWATIMTYDCSRDCRLLRQWSNPDVMYNGSATGRRGNSNSVAVLNATAQTVSRFR
jgi:hypothetical protein